MNRFIPRLLNTHFSLVGLVGFSRPTLEPPLPPKIGLISPFLQSKKMNSKKIFTFITPLRYHIIDNFNFAIVFRRFQIARIIQLIIWKNKRSYRKQRIERIGLEPSIWTMIPTFEKFIWVDQSRSSVSGTKPLKSQSCSMLLYIW